MRSYLFVAALVVFALFSAPNLVSAEPPSVSATCNITCTVAEVVEWSDASFPAIELADLTTQNSQPSGSASLVLCTNGDVKITADNSDAARLSKDDNHKLVTEYRLEYDAFGANETGGSMMDWSGHDSFLSEGSTVTHVSGDGAVVVTLLVRASISSEASENSGKYTAIQTLTVCWKS